MAKVVLKVKKQDPPPKTNQSDKKVLLTVKNNPSNGYNLNEKDIDENLPEYERAVRSFYQNYLHSPMYRKRLETQGYPNPDDAINLRNANLDVTKVEKGTTGTSEYQPSAQKITISPYDYLANKYLKPKSTAAHEISHVVGAMHPLTDKMPFPMTMHNNEVNEILKRNRLSRMDRSSLPAEQQAIFDHDINPHETKADIDTLRFLLHSDGIYDAGKQQITKDILQKAKSKYNNEAMVRRLFNYFSEDDIMWMMNNIAKTQASNPGSNNA